MHDSKEVVECEHNRKRKSESSQELKPDTHPPPNTLRLSPQAYKRTEY